MDRNVIYGDFTVAPSGWTGSSQFPMKDDGQDVYHCTAACRSYQAAPQTGNILITLSTWYSYNPVEVGPGRYRPPRHRLKRGLKVRVDGVVSNICQAASSSTCATLVS